MKNINNLTAEKVNEALIKAKLFPLPYVILDAWETNDFDEPIVNEHFARCVTLEHIKVLYEEFGNIVMFILDGLYDVDDGYEFIMAHLAELPILPYRLEEEKKEEKLNAERADAVAYVENELTAWVNSRTLLNCQDKIPSYDAQFAHLDFYVDDEVDLDTSYERMTQNSGFWPASKEELLTFLEKCEDTKLIEVILQENPWATDIEFCFSLLSVEQVFDLYIETPALALPSAIDTFELMHANVCHLSIYALRHPLTVDEIKTVEKLIMFEFDCIPDKILSPIVEVVRNNQTTFPELYKEFQAEELF